MTGPMPDPVQPELGRLARYPLIAEACRDARVMWCGACRWLVMLAVDADGRSHPGHIPHMCEPVDPGDGPARVTVLSADGWTLLDLRLDAAGEVPA